MRLSDQTTDRIADARERFLEADKKVYGGTVVGGAEKAAAVTELVVARHGYQKALEKGERELGLSA